MTNALQQQVDEAISREEWGQAMAALRQLFLETPSLATAQFVLDRATKSNGHTRSASCRLAVLRSFTVEPVIPLLRASAALYGIEVSAQVGDFNTYVQDILNPNSSLYQFEPDIAVLAVQTRDLVPDLWKGYADLSPADVQAIVDSTVSDLRNWIGAFRARSSAHLILHNLELPPHPSAGLLDSQSAQGQCEAILEINRRMKQAASENTGVYVLDYDGVVARYGRTRWFDERKWLTMRMPIVADGLRYLADAYLRFVLSLMGKVCKALVVDLDNTLWGGVIGEDGMHGIKLGTEYPGAAFVGLQRAILDLYQRGIILAVCSKNNREDAMEVIEQHPAMLLRPHHFAALRINWNDKAQNLREIASELNIGIDSLAFLDDNPVERERVISELPEVTVFPLSSDPMTYAQVLRDAPVFERLSLSAEDRERGRYYAEQRQREETRQSAGSLEEFYTSLQMQMEIAPVAAETVARTAQLTQKTNQFNLTTRRYSEQEIAEMAKDSARKVYALRVCDRFGDNGLVGVVITQTQNSVCEVDTFLLSCRVIGRTIETAVLAFLAEEGRKSNARHLRGWYLPTKKNTPCKDVYPQHGFRQIEEQDGGSLWELDLSDTPIESPTWIKVLSRDYTGTKE